MKALGSSTRNPIHSFSCPFTAGTAPVTRSPNITHFSGLGSSIRTTNPANRIRFLRIVASILSLGVFTKESRLKIGGQCDYALAIRYNGSRGCGNLGAAHCSGMSVDSMWRGHTISRTSGSSIQIFNSKEALVRSCRMRAEIRKLHLALRMHMSTSMDWSGSRFHRRI